MLILLILHSLIAVPLHLICVIHISCLSSYKVDSFPGLPPSPPSRHSSSATIDDLPAYPGNENNGMTIKPLGVDVSSRMRKKGIPRNMIIVIVISSITAFVVCMGLIWLLLFKRGCYAQSPEQPPHILVSSQGKTSGKLY